MWLRIIGVRIRSVLVFKNIIYIMIVIYIPDVQYSVMTMETMTYISAMMLILFLFVARRYFVMAYLDGRNDAHRQIMSAQRGMGRVALSMMVVLVGLLYVMGEASIAFDLSLLTAFVAVLGVAFGGLTAFSAVEEVTSP